MRGRRAVRALALAGIVAVVGAACSPSDDAGGKNVTLTVWSWRTEDVAAYHAMFAAFHKDHPDIQVEFHPYKNTEYNTILQTGLTKSGGPDVPQLRSYGLLQPLVEAGDLLPLDQKVDVSGFDPAVLGSAKGRKDGKLYGVPAAVQTLQVYYNKKIFADHHLDVPTTWQQFLAACDALRSAGVTPIATTGKDTWMLPIVMDIFGSARYGGSTFEKQVLHGQATITDPRYVSAVQTVKDLQKYYPKDVVGVSYTDSQALFFSGKAAMFPGGSFELGFFTKQNPDLDLGVFDVPPPPGSAIQSPVTPGYADGSFGVNAKSPHRKEALELVRWMATRQFGQMYSDQLDQISPVPGVTPKNPLLATMTRNYTSHPAPYLMLVDFRYGDPSGTDLVGAGLQKLLLGNTDAHGVAASTEKGLSQWFTPTP